MAKGIYEEMLDKMDFFYVTYNCKPKKLRLGIVKYRNLLKSLSGCLIPDPRMVKRKCLGLDVKVDYINKEIVELS